MGVKASTRCSLHVHPTATMDLTQIVGQIQDSPDQLFGPGAQHLPEQFRE